MLRVGYYSLLMKLLQPWMILLGIYLTVLLLAFVFERKLKCPFNLFLRQIKLQAKFMGIAFFTAMTFDVVFKVFFNKEFWQYSNNAQLILMTFLMLRYLSCVIDDLYIWQCSLLEQEDKTSVATGLNGVKHLVKASVFLFFLIIALDQINVSYSWLLALGGVAMLAGAFAIKDIVQNVFGGLVLFLDQPFKVGDEIECVSANVKGTVRHIGWQSTHLLGEDKVPIIVPNSQFISAVVLNFSERSGFLIEETLVIGYLALVKAPDIISDMKRYLESQAFVDQKDTIEVYLKAFGGSSIDIAMRCIVLKKKSHEYHALRAQILRDCTDIIDKYGATYVVESSSH